MIRSSANAIALAVLLAAVSCCSGVRAAESDLARAKAFVVAYKEGLLKITGGLEPLRPLFSLRSAVTTLDTLRNETVQNNLLNQFHPVGLDGQRLTGEAEMAASERFLSQLSEVAMMTDALDKCVAAIIGSQSEFERLPLGNVILSQRFLPVSVVAAFLRAADLTGRAAELSASEVDELAVTFREAAHFRKVERGLGVRCEEAVTNYKGLRLGDERDPNSLVSLDFQSAHMPIENLPD